MSLSLSNVTIWLRKNWSLLLLIAAVGLYFTLRTSPTAGIDSLQALDASVQTGQPVVLEFYSNL
jgi:hypothetical protein